MQFRLFNLANIERYLFRPAFVFFTFALVVVAIFQASGRLSVYIAHVFETEINAVLGTLELDARGVRGDWRGLNPVLRVRRLEFPAGVVEGVEAELDVLESIARNVPVARLLKVDNASVHLEKSPQGWRLRGMPAGDNMFDISDFLRHSDELAGRVSLHLHSESGAVETIIAQLWLANRGGVHHASISAQNSAAPERQLRAQLWQREAVVIAQDPANAVTVSGSLLLPEILTGMPELVVEHISGDWRDENEIGSGSFEIAVDGVTLPDTEAQLRTEFAVNAQRNQNVVRGRASDLRIAVAADELSVGPVYVDVQVPEQESALQAAAELLVEKQPQPALKIWLEQLDLGEVGGFFERNLGHLQPAGAWVKGLAMQGQANNVHAYADPDMGIGYLATLSDLETQGHKGAPSMTNMQARVWGYERGIAVQVNASDVDLAFPDLYHSGWHVETIQGVVKAWAGKGYFGMRGSHLRANFDESDIAGGFAITRPGERHEQRLSLQFRANEVGLSQARSFVPYKIPEALAQWLERGPKAALLVEPHFAYHGQVHLRPGELGRRIALLSSLKDGRVEYAEGWPEVRDLSAEIHVSGVNTSVNVASARSREVIIQRANIVLHDNTAYATGSIETQSDMGAALDFVRASPLTDTLSFVAPGWQGSGRLNLRGDLVIPIRAEQAPPLTVDLDFDVDRVALAMPDYRLVTRELTGQGDFTLPHKLRGDFSGSLFGQPASIQAAHDDDWLLFNIAGKATPDDVYGLLEHADTVVPIEGEFGFDSVLSVAMTGGVSNLFVKSDLVGLAVNLPGEFAKDAASVVDSELNMQFLKNYQSVSYRYRDAIGWLHYGDGIERGALGVREPPPMTAQEERAIVIAGHMPSVVLSEWVSNDGNSAVSLPLDWTIQNLRVDEFRIDELVFPDLVMTGNQRGTDVEFGFVAPTVRGSVEIPGDDIMSIKLDYVQVPASEDEFEAHIGKPQEDPIGIVVGESLPAANVTVAQLDIGDEPFGSWRFVIDRNERQVVFRSFGADVNGVHIDESLLTWDLDSDISSFSGNLEFDDLAETLPKWDYAPSLSTGKASASADVHWGGSPLNVSLLGTSGEFNFVARDGRFNEVETGNSGLRIMSLLNFSKLANRINFDFSDVVGNGISFDKARASVALDEGDLSFPEPMTVDSSSGDFQVGGRVDLRSGQLDNEMIVTLPVSKSLPWYGVYLALANPLVGLGVVVGERVLRKPIEQFSTAKFEVTGTLDDPEVNFVSLWDKSMRETTVDEPISDEPTAGVGQVSNPALAGEPTLVESTP